MNTQGQQVHSFTIYFNMFDVNARGYVRRCALSYVTTEWQKFLGDIGTQLREELMGTIRSLRLSNVWMFVVELVKRIADILFTIDNRGNSLKQDLDYSFKALKRVIESSHQHYKESLITDEQGDIFKVLIDANDLNAAVDDVIQLLGYEVILLRVPCLTIITL